MILSHRKKGTLFVLGAALLLGASFALLDGRVALATSHSVSNPAARDAYGVIVIRPAVREDDDSFLRSARLRDDLARAIVVH